jgi:hypothetical protein
MRKPFVPFALIEPTEVCPQFADVCTRVPRMCVRLYVCVWVRESYRTSVCVCEYGRVWSSADVCRCDRRMRACVRRSRLLLAVAEI